jgi:hypothetical protein
MTPEALADTDALVILYGLTAHIAGIALEFFKKRVLKKLGFAPFLRHAGPLRHNMIFEGQLQGLCERAERAETSANSLPSDGRG